MEDDRYIIRGPEPSEPLPKNTLAELFWNLLINTDPNHVVMIDAHTDSKLTAKTLLEDACKLAEALRIYLNNESAILSLCSENNLHFFRVVLASVFAGTILVPLNVNYTPEELGHKFNLTKPRVIFCSKRSYPKYLKIKETMGFIEKIIVIDSEDKIPRVETVKEFVRSNLKRRWITPQNFSPFSGDAKKQIAFILCSSGTTGLPKGVMLSHYNVAVRMLQSRDPRYLSKNTVVLGLMPFFHSYGLFFGLSSIFNSHLTIMMDRYGEDFFLKSIQDYKISVVRITPPLAIFLAKSPKVHKYDLSSVVELFSAAAPLGGDIEEALKKRLNIKNVHQAYGCTEGTLALTIMEKDDVRTGSCGKVITYMIGKVRDPESGKSLPPNEVGELCFKGPTVMMGYYRNEEETKQSFTPDGWLRTGDLGYYDNDEYFYIVDRLKEVIKYKGFQVAPAELEAILVTHPKVLESGVVGLPDEYAGELPLAFVVKRPGVEITEKELQDYVAAKVSPPKKLRGGVVFVESIPKNPSGKILRKELRKVLQKYHKQVKSKI